MQGFAKISAPLNALLKDLPDGSGKGSKQPVYLDKQAREAFHSLVDEMTSPPMLALPVLNPRFSSDTDASPHQIGVAYFREDEEGTRKPVGFWSWQLTTPGSHYSATEKECLTLVWPFKHYAPTS